MRVTLAHPWAETKDDGKTVNHKPDTTVDVDVETAEKLVNNGLARSADTKEA